MARLLRQDHVLTALARDFRDWHGRFRVRKIDLLARIGGEEFAILLPGTELGAASVAEKLRRLVPETPVESEGHVIHLTASFGFAQVWASDDGIDEALARADSALYEAKRSGRNCVKSFAVVH